jgi:hypothetical protein
MIGVGLLVLLGAFVRFALEGIGTPALLAPTERLVVGAPLATCGIRCASPSPR